MGSKSRIAKHIVPIIQSYIDDTQATRYIEPFVGGANIIDKIKCEHRFGLDKHPYLIALLQHVQDGLPLYDTVSRELYNDVRNAVNNGDTSAYKDWQVGCVGFLASYNGRYFDGGYAKPGYEKTKNGQRYRDYYQEAKTNLLKQAPNLKDICFFTSDYSRLMIRNDRTTVIYCDPPYQGQKQYANAIAFDYKKFWDTMRKWAKVDRTTVLISEQHAPNDFQCIWEQEVSRSIKAQDKSKATEKLWIYRGD